MNLRQCQALTVGLYLAAMSVLIGLSLRATAGRLIYTLDDPYIHLAVSESILAGGYGVNIGEAAAPSSSVIWPYLMAGLLRLGLGDTAPLIVSVTATAIVVWLVAGLLARSAVGIAMQQHRWWLVPLCSLVLIVGFNGYALPMTGMEHSLHVLTSILVVLCLHRSTQYDRTAPMFTAVALTLNALVRYEGLALSLAAIVMLLWLRKRAAAAPAITGLVITFGAFALYMHSLGLPVLPSSVLLKSGVAAGAMDGGVSKMLAGLLAAVQDSLQSRSGTIFALSAALFTAEALRHRKTNPMIAAVSLPTAAALLAHITAGKYGWFGRYEVYAFALVLVTGMLIFGARSLSLRLNITQIFLGGTAFVLAALPNVQFTILTPAASQNIYQQQFQMHRFATEFFPQRVAVTDLGWVTYRNDQYVLDLYGLGSESVRRLKSKNRLNVEQIEALVTNQNIAYTMLYDGWFKGVIPRTWCRMAVLHTSRVSTAYDAVNFYSITLAERAAMYDALMRFAPSLPEGAILTIDENSRGTCPAS